MSSTPSPRPPADLDELASRIASAPLHDELVLEGLHQHLRSFLACDAGWNERLRGYLDAASALMRSVTHLADARAEEVRGMLVRLLRLAHDEGATSDGRSAVDSIAPALPSVTSAAGLATINDIALGELMVELGLIEPEQVDEALRRQVRTGKPFGETLIELGCSTEAVQQCLELQEGLARPIQSIYLGEALIAMRKIDRGQLEQGLAFQKRRDVRLGAALVALGFVTWPEVNEALAAQGHPRAEKKRP